jgi:hypothetical protein
MKAKVRKTPVGKGLTAEQKRGLEDVDQLLKTLIRQNRRLHARVDRLAHAVTSLGEPEIERLLKALRKRVHAPARTRGAILRRRARAA